MTLRMHTKLHSLLQYVHYPHFTANLNYTFSTKSLILSLKDIELLNLEACNTWQQDKKEKQKTRKQETKKISVVVASMWYPHLVSLQEPQNLLLIHGMKKRPIHVFVSLILRCSYTSNTQLHYYFTWRKNV